MKKAILGRIVKGIVNGFPIVQTIKKAIKGEVVVDEKGNHQIVKTPVDAVALISEFVTVGLVAAFVFGKISIEDLTKLLELINQ